MAFRNELIERLVILSPYEITSFFTGNPLEEKHSQEGDWRDQVLKRLSKLKKLDGVPVVSQAGEEEG